MAISTDIVRKGYTKSSGLKRKKTATVVIVDIKRGRSFNDLSNADIDEFER